MNDRARAPHPTRTVVIALAVTAVDAALMAAALGGPGALISHPRALALLALWAASSLLLGFLRPVGAQDVNESEREPAAIRLALLLIPLLIPALSALTERFAWWPLPGGVALRWGGVALAGLGLTLRIAAMTRLGSRFSPRVALQRDHSLETSGLYARMRHPGYFGALIANLGAALAFGSAAGVIAVLLLSLVVRSRIAREETLLERRFGDEYRRYRARTGALWPRVRSPRD